MKKILLLIAFALLSSSFVFSATELNQRVDRAAVVLKEIAEAPDKSIPRDLLDKSTCVTVIPGMKKAGFIIGGNYGKGVQ